MNLRNIIILVFIIVFLISYFNDLQNKSTETNEKDEKMFIIQKDSNELYVNPSLLNNESDLNIIKKYADNKINIVSNFQNNQKNMYDTIINTNNNTNTNKNNLLHFINFLI